MRRSLALWYFMVMEQLGHSTAAWQAVHFTWVEYPRRFISRMVCSPAWRLWCISWQSSWERPSAGISWLCMSRMVTSGSRAGPYRLPSSTRR